MPVNQAIKDSLASSSAGILDSEEHGVGHPLLGGAGFKVPLLAWPPGP